MAFNGVDCSDSNEEEGVLEDFFSQLCLIPSDEPTSGRQPRFWETELRARNLVWIRKDLWETK